MQSGQYISINQYESFEELSVTPNNIGDPSVSHIPGLIKVDKAV